MFGFRISHLVFQRILKQTAGPQIAGFLCNLEFVGNHGLGTSWVHEPLVKTNAEKRTPALTPAVMVTQEFPQLIFSQLTSATMRQYHTIGRSFY